MPAPLCSPEKWVDMELQKSGIIFKVGAKGLRVDGNKYLGMKTKCEECEADIVGSTWADTNGDFL